MDRIVMLALAVVGVVLPGVVWSQVSVSPTCGQGNTYFLDFSRCDATVGYCYNYDNSSCVGPPAWADVDIYNVAAGLLPQTLLDSTNTLCCDGDYNSPINIPTANVQSLCNDPRMTTPTYVNPQQVVFGKLKNNGVSPKFGVKATDDGQPPLLTNVPFSCVVSSGSDNFDYILAEFHVHVGPTGQAGSEHFVDNRGYDAELHMVHVREDFYGDDGFDLKCATQTPMGLSVIGIFLSLTEGEDNSEFNKIFSPSKLQAIQQASGSCPFDDICNADPSSIIRPLNLDPLTCSLNNVVGGLLGGLLGGGSVSFPQSNCNATDPTQPCADGYPVVPDKLLPSIRDFYHYFGGLTTPPCSEVVNWIVMKNPIKISQQQ